MSAAAGDAAKDSVAAAAEDAAERSACRLDALRQVCAEQGIDALYLRSLSDIRWLTAFDGVFDEEAAHALAVTPHQALLHTDSRYAEACRQAAGTGPVSIDAQRKNHATWLAHDVLGAAQSTHPAFVLGIEDDLPLCEYRRLVSELGLTGGLDLADVPGQTGELGAAVPGSASELRANLSPADASHAADSSPACVSHAAVCEVRETSELVLGLRAVKDAAEIARMRAAQAVTDAAFAHILGFIRPGMTEREVQIELEDFMRRNGADDLAFSSIVATGANGASPHAIPGNTVLEAGQCVVFDFGARRFGYCSDMTRTVFLGQPTQRLRDAYVVLREANEAVEAALRPGVTGAQMQALAEQVLSDGGFAGVMGHGLGHGVGLDVHEQPCLNQRNSRPLKAGNVVTVEPGIYLAGEFGMRLEDFGVVTPNGFDVFTKSTHDMVVL